jgi:SAM-dependent methyltransferase
LHGVIETTAGFQAAGPCWVCGSGDQRPVHQNVFDLAIYRDQDPQLAEYTGEAVAMVRCLRCGFTQPAHLPALDRYFQRMYDQRWSPGWVASEFESGAKRAIFDTILDALERRLPPARRSLLDIGAHGGTLVAMAQSRGWRAEGMEPNPTTAAYARERTRAVVHDGPMSDLAALGPRFDAVTLIDVLEHIPYPVETLRAAARVMAPGGCIAIKVPCGPNQLRKERMRAAIGRADRVSVADNLVHVSHFTPGSLRLALERSGFADIVLTVGRPERVDGTGARAMATNALRSAVYAAARVLGGARSPIAFNLQAYARRAGGAEKARA